MNNSLCFPGIFRGVLDVRARTITDGMAIAAAHAIAETARQGKISAERIVPRMDESTLYPRVAAAAALAAQAEGVARLTLTAEALMHRAQAMIANAQSATAALMREGLIAAPPV